jgi:pilin isopeptide linkage protein
MILLAGGALASVPAYAAEYPLTFTVEQIVEPDSSGAERIFWYKLEPHHPDNPMPAGSTAEGYAFKITGNSSIEIGPFRYDRQDVYRYKLYQVIEVKKPGYTYDSRIYTIEVHVDGLQNVTLIVINVDGSKAASIRFENGYHGFPGDPEPGPGPPVREKVPNDPADPGDPVTEGNEYHIFPKNSKLVTSLSIKKTVSGYPSDAATFEFRLIAGEASYPLPADSVNGVNILKIMGSGEGEFGAWSYDKAGIYDYTVHEVNTGASGYVYDTRVYTVTDTVREENGQLVLSRTIEDGSSHPVASLVFLNRFEERKPGPLTGDDIKTALFYILFWSGGAVAMSAATFLIAGKIHKMDDQHEDQ